MMFNVLQAAAGLDPMLADSLAGNVAPAAPETMTQSFSLIQMAAKGGWLMIITTMLATLTIAALVLYLMGKANDPKVLLCSACTAGLIFILLVIKWIAGGSLFSSLGDILGSLMRGSDMDISLHLSVAGWFMFFSELGAAALAILGFLQAKKN